MTTAAAQPKSQGGIGRSARPTMPCAAAAPGQMRATAARAAASVSARLRARGPLRLPLDVAAEDPGVLRERLHERRRGGRRADLVALGGRGPFRVDHDEVTR